MHVDELVKPVAQHVNRIPFRLQEKVDAKLDESLELDTIEEVLEGLSGWITPLVVVPEGNGDVRVCAELMKQLLGSGILVATARVLTADH